MQIEIKERPLFVRAVGIGRYSNAIYYTSWLPNDGISSEWLKLWAFNGYNIVFHELEYK